MNLIKAWVLGLMCVVALSGCSSDGPTKKDGAQAGAAAGRGGAGGAGEGGPQIGRYGRGGSGSGSGSGAGGYGAGGYGDGAGGLGDPNDPNSLAARRVIYFEYDSFQVLPDYVPVVNGHAAYLAANPGRSVTLEGHADERGSSEYNVALAEQRARAVARMMSVQGVSDDQIQIVSFGEEKPALGGHEETSWQQNRRVELTYSGR